MIILKPYNANWPSLYEQEKEILMTVGGKWIEAIEHIGSTSIPNIYAKPVIDIMMGLKNLSIADQHLVQLIQQLGYDYIAEYEKQMPYRRYFQKINGEGGHTHHIHLVETGTEFWNRHIAFRDYLRNHSDIAKEYEALKLSLAPKFTDTNAYASAKTDFIKRVEALANQ